MLRIHNKNMMVKAILLATLSLSACGKKKDLVAPPPPASQTTQNKDVKSRNDRPDGKGGNLGGGIGKELPNPNDDSGSQQNGNPPNHGNPPGGGYNPPPRGGGSNDNGITPLPPEYGSRPEGNPLDNSSKRVTGGLAENGLLYTSSANDNLMSFLRARNEKVSYDTRRANIDAASSVVAAVLSEDSYSADVTVSLKVREGNEIKIYNLSGASPQGSYATPLRPVGDGSMGKTTGNRNMDGTIKCLDLDGGCETVFARLRVASYGSSAIINVVFRNSAADLHFQLAAREEQSKNPEFLQLRSFIMNSAKGAESSSQVKFAFMSSWEVVNGRSGVTVSIKGENNELLAFAGALLAPEAGSGINLPMVRMPGEGSDSLNLLYNTTAKLKYANWIGDARMVANNGSGQVRVLLTMRQRSNYKRDRIEVTFSRNIKPLVELTDDNLR